MPTGVGLASMLQVVAPVATGATACRSWPIATCYAHCAGCGGLLIRTIRMRRVHHMQGGADDVTGLLIAALTASTHANRRGRGSEVLLSLPCDGSQQSCCW